MRPFLSLLTILLLIPAMATAETIYVDTSGSDNSSCGSYSSPCRSVEYAVEQRASGGDVVSVNDGTYSEGQIEIPSGVSLTSTSSDSSKAAIVPNQTFPTSVPMLVLKSLDPGSEGNQEISFITLDGRDGPYNAKKGIEVRNRNHVTIHDCVIREFYGTSDQWYVNWGLKVWSNEVTHTSSSDYLKTLANSDFSKSSNYPPNPVEDFRFYNNEMYECGDGGLDSSSRRVLSQAIWPWHLYNSSFHDNHIDVSHRPAQAITATSSLLEEVDFYNNVLIGNSVGSYPGSTTSESLYLIELWGLWNCSFYNNKLINGCFSTVFGKNNEWYDNYVDRSQATDPVCIAIEATNVNQANIHHNKLVGNPDAGRGMGMTIGPTGSITSDVLVHIWSNIFHGNKAHTIQFKAIGDHRRGTLDGHIYNNIIDLTGNSGGYSGIDIMQQGMGEIRNAYIINNIITNNRGTDIRLTGDVDSLVIDNNIFFNNTIEYGLPQTNSIIQDPSYIDYSNDNFEILSLSSVQVDSGAPLGSMYQMGLHPDTYWERATSEDLPRVVLAIQDDHGSGWEIGPYVWNETVLPPCTPDWSCQDTGCGECVGGQMPCTETCTDLNGCEPDTQTPVNRSCISIPHGNVTSSFAHSPITLDGQALEPAWEQSGPAILDNDTMEGYWPGTAPIPDPQDASLSSRSSWDDQNIYFLVEVTDDLIIADSPLSSLWRDDGFEIYLEGTKNDIHEYTEQDNDIMFSSDGRVRDTKGKGWNNTIQLSSSQTSQGYALEIAIPWTTIGASPHSGHQCGFALQLNDDDGADPDISLFWRNPGDFNTDTNAFKTLDLVRYHRADLDASCSIETNELTNYIDLWHGDSTSNPMHSLMEAISYFNSGSAC